MKRFFYIMGAGLLILGSCKNTPTKTEGFVINAKMDEALPAESMALLSYKQNDSLITDSTMVKDGEFTFKGLVAHPIEATISLRHGNTFTEKSWRRDNFNFYIDNSEMTLTANDSVKNAILKGSLLTDQSIEIEQQTNPMLQKIIAMNNSSHNEPKPSMEVRIANRDTIDIMVDSIAAVVHRFIDANRDSYIAFSRFARHEVGSKFDAQTAETEYNKFNKILQNTPLGKKVWERIAIAKQSMIGEKAMDFTQTDLAGNPFKLSSLKGKYVLVDFWASWCAPCRKENPFVVKAYNEFKDQNFEIVGVSLDAGHEPWEMAVEKDGLNWIHVSDLKGWNNDVALQYGIRSVPSNFIIDPDGIIISKNLRGESLFNHLSDIFSKKE